MQDLTGYSDQELSMNFENDESLYKCLLRAARNGNFADLQELADELFIYTPEQLEDLKETFNAEVEELQE